ncbi:MAG TPA: hypothetical protein PK200_11945 [Spirochaetota bacterium]|mgnify:CR=1 FL=1|nr:hypothetical protein [Spirochaetota bacterium]HQO01638.1 hypothetical protein [Spirochaetota bacterium]HQP48963.1 hypothetical protein [Spirochaetota bacterium]
MAAIGELFEYKHVPDPDVLVGIIKKSVIEREEADVILDYILNETEKLFTFDNYILDVSKVEQINAGVVGILMKSLNHLKKYKGYVILVMSESFLQKIMLQHPEMFDFYAVFHSIEDAVTYIQRHK